MLTITMQTENAAFIDGSPFDEIQACLLRVINKLARGERRGSVMDTNGNRVGEFEWKEEE